MHVKNCEELLNAFKTGCQKGAMGNPCARIDVQKFNVYIAVRSTLVIIAMLYVPQIPARVWTGFSEFASILLLGKVLGESVEMSPVTRCEYRDGLDGRAGFHMHCI